MKDDIRKDLRPHYLTDPCFGDLLYDCECCEDCPKFSKCCVDEPYDEG